MEKPAAKAKVLSKNTIKELGGSLALYRDDIKDRLEYLGMKNRPLNEDNKVSLFVRYLDPATGETETRIVNKNA